MHASPRVGKLTDDDAAYKAALALLACIRCFTDERIDIPSQYIATFLLVATAPGKSVGEYAMRAGVSKSVMSRHLLDIGIRHRTGEPGLNLVYTKPNIKDLRTHEVYLTDKGQRLYYKLAQHWKMSQ